MIDIQSRISPILMDINQFTVKEIDFSRISGITLGVTHIPHQHKKCQPAIILEKLEYYEYNAHGK